MTGCGCGCGGGCGCDQDCPRPKKSRRSCLAGTSTVGTTTIDLANTDRTLTREQLGTGILRLTSAPALTANRTLTLPSGTYTLVVSGDASLGPYTVTLTTGTGSTVNVGAGDTFTIDVLASGAIVRF